MTSVESKVRAGKALSTSHPALSPCSKEEPVTADILSDCAGCAGLREQNRQLASLLTDEADALHAVREYALECGSRAGALIDAATVAARLWPILAGLDLKPRVCPVCVERRLALVKHAEVLDSLAGLRRVG